MERRIDACLFDLDEAVVCTDRYHLRAWKRLAQEEGWTLDHETTALLRGLPRTQCLELILKRNRLELSVERKNALSSRKNTYLVQELCGLGSSDVVAGVERFLGDLRLREIKLGLFSLSQNAGVILETLSLRGAFDVILSGKDDRCSYYNPDIFVMCARMLNVKPERCVVFESVDSAAQFALDARMHVVGVGIPDMLSLAGETVRDYGAVNVDRLLETGLVG